MQTGVDRAVYSKMVEQRPSMFTNEGRDFKEWAARCGKWWESFRGSSAFRKKVIEDLKFMDYAPVLFISALTGQRVPKVLESVREVYGQTSRRVTTGLLNDILADATTALQPPYISGRRLKIYYATQQSVCPPTFVLFVNDEKLMHFAYQRYLENQFRKSFGFEGTPIRFILRNKNQKGDDVK